MDPTTSDALFAAFKACLTDNMDFDDNGEMLDAIVSELIGIADKHAPRTEEFQTCPEPNDDLQQHASELEKQVTDLTATVEAMTRENDALKAEVIELKSATETESQQPVKKTKKAKKTTTSKRSPNAYSLFVKAVGMLRKDAEAPNLQIAFVPKPLEPDSKAAQKFNASDIDHETSYSIAAMIQLVAEQGVTNIMSQASVIWAMVPDETKSIVKDAMAEAMTV